MSIYTPFTYLITHIPTGKRYYGVRIKRGCQPSDIGTIYFSSSKIVKKMIAEEGLDKFKFEVRRTFDDAKKALHWEERVLTRLKVWENDAWLNQSNGGKNFTRLGCVHSPETRKRISDKSKNYRHTKETIDKRNESIRNAYQDPETRKKTNPYLNKTYDEIVTLIEKSKEGKQKNGGHKPHSKETYKRMADARRGKPYSIESRLKMVEAWRIRKAIAYMKQYGKRRPFGPYIDQIKC